MGKIKIEGYICERCGHKWVPRNTDEKPRVCPRCKSPYWDRPRKNKKRQVKNERKNNRTKKGRIFEENKKQ